MTRTSLLLAFALFTIPALHDVATAPAALAEDPPAESTVDAEADAAAKKHLDGLKKEIGKQAEITAVATCNKLVSIWQDPKVSDEVKSVVPTYLSKLAGNKKEAVVVAAVGAFAKLGPEVGTKPVMKTLQKALKAKNPPVPVYSACLNALGALADPNPKVVKELTKLLKYKLDDVVGKAARAISGYNEAPGKLRKSLLEEVIKQSEGVFNTARGNDANAKRKWNIISSGIMIALNRLSKQSFKDPSEARAWYNDHKKDRDLWK